MLNVAAAQAYEALIVIHTLKYPLGRPLNALRELAKSIHPELAMVWTGLQGEQIFDHLSIAFRDDVSTVFRAKGSRIRSGLKRKDGGDHTLARPISWPEIQRSAPRRWQQEGLSLPALLYAIKNRINHKTSNVISI